MPSSVVDSALLRDLYGTEEMRRIFADESLVQRWLDVEAALAQAEAEFGVIPAWAAVEIGRQARVELLDLTAIKREIDRTGHAIVAFIRVFQALCEGEAGQYIHWGATTQDIIDSATVLQLGDACQVIVRELRDIEGLLIDLAERHRDTIMAARTHGQQALPTTFGFKVAGWMREIRRHLVRCGELRPRLLVGQLGGAVGTMASFGPQALEVQRRTLEILGLGVPDVTWHASRDRFAELANVLALVAGTLARIGNEVYELQKTEFGELEEPFAPGKVGSSTMPHKRNPQLCEAVVFTARTVQQNAGLMLAAMVQEHERDTRLWRLEWHLLPESCIMLGAALHKTRLILGGLRVNTTRMRENLDLLRGLLLSEAVMLALAERVGRQEAHEIVYEVAMPAFERGAHLADALAADPRVIRHLDRAAIAELLRPERYLGLAPQLVDELVAQTRRERVAEAEHPA
ncbi:MAG: adenylosuccinate lyase [Chloroflexi bacterium]|nr:adenylosuccinate lyase [Chloroflexota bacterium]